MKFPETNKFQNIPVFIDQITLPFLKIANIWTKKIYVCIFIHSWMNYIQNN